MATTATVRNDEGPTTQQGRFPVSCLTALPFYVSIGDQAWVNAKREAQCQTVKKKRRPQTHSPRKMGHEVMRFTRHIKEPKGRVIGVMTDVNPFDVPFSSTMQGSRIEKRA